ncbi:hypothetical protein RGQ29_013375 [Quercus rubra]|uniref:Receptor-like serine/threonine-protein kinase n=1 Tax=Quercus rubra TaxID=3512 RepID=A0AAN7G9G3_QUERU|nr:hypothetical protein RGQ29_013375 [Quercus rubra]
MGVRSSWACCGFLLYLALFLTPFPSLATVLSPNSSTPSSWTTGFSAPNNTVTFDNGSVARSILISEKVSMPRAYYKYGCGCGFFCYNNKSCNSFLFAIFGLYYDEDDSVLTYVGPHVVWSANPNNPVSANAKLQFTSNRGLVLQDANGTEVWSANISNSKNVASRLLLTDTCNLMLLGKNNYRIWQSYDHPTDTLVVGQTLKAGKNLTSKGGLFTLSLTSQGFFAYINSNPPQLSQLYFSYNISGYVDSNIGYVKFENGSLVFYTKKDERVGLAPSSALSASEAQYTRYTRFDADGHLRVYAHSRRHWDDILLARLLSSCEFPTSSTGDCYLESQIFSMMIPISEEFRYSSMRFKICIKVQDVMEQSVQRQKHGLQKHGLKIIVGSSVTFGLFLLIGSFVFLIWKKRSADEGDEYYLDHIPGMSTRYSYDDLQSITANFNKELGAGGFGTVFEGTLIDGTKVAVKRLDGLNQIKRSFLAEVETIGSIHHFNLVRLIGFCAEKSHRLLVYEYMSNGSLDKWLFDKNLEILLDWQHRKKIILDIARGLTYLHEDCRQKIVHLDIKPQNILLDENFNAKVSDFGLSKLVDRDQSQVVTVMRGTPGYMAPEWLSSVITEKVDVYSFGVVLLEILCGRRNLDRSQPEETMHLLHLFKKKIEEDQLLDLVDKFNEDMQLHGVEVVNIMRVAAWCLQIDFTKRPSMSTVVKVLEGVANVEYDLGYFFSNPLLPSTSAGVDNQPLHVGDSDTTQLLPSILSGPR